MSNINEFDTKALNNDNALNDLLSYVNHNTGTLSSFVILFYSQMSTPIDIGLDKKVTVIEMSILISIAENPGITGTELSRTWHKTKGAISQLLKKLEEKELIYRIKSDKDSKVYFLHPTQKGIEVKDIYLKRDLYMTSKIVEQLLKTCSKDEIRGFYNVIKQYSKLITNKNVI